MKKKKYDFGGFATKSNIVCSDGVSIAQSAFKKQSGTRVPLVWQHQHDTPLNVLGHADLESRPDGIYCKCTFNKSELAQSAKESVQHGDINSLSIFANQLKRLGNTVADGLIREVSLVIGGANPGAKIDTVNLTHSDSFNVDSEAIIYMPCYIDIDSDIIEHSDTQEDSMQHDGKTIGDIYNGMTDEQKTAVAAILEQAMTEQDTSDEQIKHNGGDSMYNLFQGGKVKNENKYEITHADMGEIVGYAKQGMTFTKAFIKHASDKYGVENIEFLFPDAKRVGVLEVEKPDDSWVGHVLSSVNATPFANVKTESFNMTAKEARAKGYIKTDEKWDGFFKLAKRITTPQTIYVKDKLEDDDISDIVDMDFVNFMKKQMKVLWRLELANAILLGDSRAVDDPMKIQEEHIRPIYSDVDPYVIRVQIPIDAKPTDVIDKIVKCSDVYEGYNKPNLYVPKGIVTDWLCIKDTTGRDIYETEAKLTSKMRIGSIIEMDQAKNKVRVVGGKKLELVGIYTNLSNYNIGTNKGGKTKYFEGFDMDFNQHKYLYEGRMSGALRKFKSAIIIERIIN